MYFFTLFLFYGLVTKKNFITHLREPICKDCVHYKNHHLVGNYEHDKCSLFGKKDFVDTATIDLVKLYPISKKTNTSFISKSMIGYNIDS